MSQAHVQTDTDSTEAATTTQPEPSEASSRPTADLDLLFSFDETVHRERRVDINSLVTFLTHALQQDASDDESISYSHAASTIVDALEARFEPYVDIQYARRNLDEKHSDHELSLGDLRMAFDDSDRIGTVGSVELYNDMVLPFLSAFAARVLEQIEADEKATHEAARRRITESIVAQTDMYELSPTDVEYAITEAKQQIESSGVW